MGVLCKKIAMRCAECLKFSLERVRTIIPAIYENYEQRYY